MGCSSSKSDPAVANQNSPKSKEGTTGKPQEQPPEEVFEPFTEFPTPVLLADAQKEYAKVQTQNSDERKENGEDPSPPPTTKETAFPPEKFGCIDQDVQKCPQHLATSPLLQLVAHLTSSATDDADKVRSFYSWILAQNLLSGDILEVPEENTGLYFLLCAKGGVGSYNTLFAEMCKLAGVPVKIVTGQVKGESYRVGHGVAYGSTWAVVFVNGTWRPVDVNLGSGFKAGYEVELSKLADTTTPRQNAATQSIDDSYFCSDPEQFIYDHFTEEIPTQLLARPVTKEEFKEMARLLPSFFALGLRNTNHPKCRISTDNGEVHLKIDVSQKEKVKFAFSFVKLRGTAELEKFDGCYLKDFVMMDVEADHLDILVSLKWIGQYKLDLHARRGNTNTTLCEYLIECERPKFNCTPHPSNPRDEFGPGADASELGITPETHTIGVIYTQDGLAEIVFQCHNPDLEFYQVLDSRHKKKVYLEGFVRHYQKDDRVVFHVRTPEHGEYILKLYAKTQSSRQEYNNFCNYLVISDVGYADQVPFSPTNYGRVGSSPGVVGILCPLSHQDAIFNEPSEGTVEIRMQSAKELDLSLLLELHTEQEDIDCTDFTWLETDGSDIKCFLRFPSAGMYNFTLFAKSDNRGIYTDVWKYVITVDCPASDCAPFPTADPDWHSSFSLMEPRTAYVMLEQQVEFEVVVPGANDVAILGDSWSCQSLYNHGEGLFKGTVDSGRGKELALAAIFDEQPDYTYLLEYKVLTAHEKADFERQQARAKGDAKIRLKLLEAHTRAARQRAEEQKKEDEETARNEELEFENNKTELWEEENEFIREAREEYERQLEKEEEQLREANRQRTKAEIAAILEEQIAQIDEAKNSEHMLLRKLQAAQKARMVREQMRDATKRKDRSNLQSLIIKFKALKLEERDDDLTKAIRVLGILDAKHDLKAAMDARDVDRIVEALENIKLKGYSSPLQGDVQAAERLVRSLQKAEQLKLSVLQMDSKTMSEIRSYARPPQAVKNVIMASLLLLGVNEDVSKDWTACRSLVQPLGQAGLNRRIHQFNVGDLHPEIAARSKEMLEHLDFKEVQKVSAGTATFYVWAMGTIEEAEKLENGQNDASPADIDRQKEILGDNVSEED